ncbi:hypothetical protein J5226_12950 [Lysobacter sp. K5869]|uniref:hypothetical protein n=1 Tax=Lysobacter sp. K5869 TaxID=2820808 RepID=UPI001C05FAEC|nr:hypothetical protein [Lysobacter sp. K5869]QWP74608.1 hypothetical protein J5226_12950 [Lysobacter sp. K5869]
MATLEQIETALRAADAAGNVEDARRLAQAYATTRDSLAAPAGAFDDVRAGVSSTDRTGAAPAPKQRTAGQRFVREVLGLGTRNVVEGAADLVGILYDPIADGVNWLGEKGPTTNSLITGQRERYFPRQARARDVSDMILDGIGVPKPETAEERVAGDVGRALTGQALTMGAGTLLQTARGAGAAAAAPTTGNALARMGDFLTAQPVQQAIAAGGGALASGAAREAGFGPGGQALAGLAGALTPAGLAAAGAAGLRGLVRGRSGAGMQQAIDDFAAVGATPSVGQASGNALIQGGENLLSKFPTSAGVVNRFAEGQADDIGAGLQAAAERLSPRASAERAGRAIDRGITGEGGFKEQTKAVQTRLYDTLDAQIDPAKRIGITNAERALPEINPAIPGAPNLSPLFQNARIRNIEGALQRDAWGAEAVGTRPGMPQVIDDARGTLQAQTDDIARINTEVAAEIQRKNVLRTALGQKPIEFVPYPEMGKPEIDNEIFALLNGKADGKLPYEALKKLRTLVGQEIENAGLMSDVPRSKWRALYGALAQDMRVAAEEAGPEAVRAWTRANNYTKHLISRMDAIVHVVDKNGGPEAVFNAALSGTRDGGTTLRAVMQSLPKEGQRAVTASVIKRMGLATPGGQDAAGDVFSAATFMTNWNRLSKEARAALFDRYGKDFSANMDRVARVASNIKEGARVYANPSGTADRAAALTYGGSLVASMFDPTLISTGGVIGGGAVARYLGGKLTDPDFVRWLANTTAVPAGAALASIQSLRALGQRQGDAELVQAADQLEAQYRESNGARTGN